MGWIKEARQITQKMYGGYCNMCRELGLTPKTYHVFKDDDTEYNEIRELYKELKRDE